MHRVKKIEKIVSTFSAGQKKKVKRTEFKKNTMENNFHKHQTYSENITHAKSAFPFRNKPFFDAYPMETMITFRQKFDFLAFLKFI